MKVREISGLALLLLGLILFVNLFLPIRLPLVGIAGALLLVCAGICLMNSAPIGRRDAPDTECEPLVRQCVLRQERLNLTDTEALPEYIRIRAVLGRMTVRLPVDAEVTICKQGALCLLRTPDDCVTVLGTQQTVCGSRSENAPRLYIEAQSLLGAITFTLG